MLQQAIGFQQASASGLVTARHAKVSEIQGFWEGAAFALSELDGAYASLHDHIISAMDIPPEAAALQVGHDVYMKVAQAAKERRKQYGGKDMAAQKLGTARIAVAELHVKLAVEVCQCGHSQEALSKEFVRVFGEAGEENGTFSALFNSYHKLYKDHPDRFISERAVVRRKYHARKAEESSSCRCHLMHADVQDDQMCDECSKIFAKAGRAEISSCRCHLLYADMADLPCESCR